MGVDIDSFNDVLKHPIRRKIILELGGGKPLSYTDLLGVVQATNTGKFNYHLKVLGDLIAKDPDGKYYLTEKGQLAAQFLQKFPEKKTQPGRLSWGDAVLVGFVGVVLTAVNPAFIAAAFLSAGYVYKEALLALSVTSAVYSWVVPGAVMWLLSVRRSHSHDAYDLFKPAFVAFALLLTFAVAMILVKAPFVVTLSTPPVKISQYGYSQTMTSMSLIGEFLTGIVFAFVGVALCEAASRVKKKLMARR